LYSFVIAYFLGVLIDFLLRKYGRKCIIDDSSFNGKFISNLQNQICNIILVSSVAITIYGVITTEIISVDQSFFIGISSLVIASTFFQTVKSDLTRIFHVSFFR